MKPPGGGLRPLCARLDVAHRTLTGSASFAGVLEELNTARAVLADFKVATGTDRVAAVADLEAARKKLRLISLAARHLLELETGLAGSGSNAPVAPTYLAASASVSSTSGSHVNVEA